MAPATPAHRLVAIAAPGSGVLSTLNSGTAGPGAESYASYNGTSMAAPHVAGVVALIQSVSSPAKTPAQVEALLKSSARAFPSTPSQPIGAGIVNGMDGKLNPQGEATRAQMATMLMRYAKLAA